MVALLKKNINLQLSGKNRVNSGFNVQKEQVLITSVSSSIHSYLHLTFNFGTFLGHPKVIMGHPEVILGHFGVILGHPKVILG